MGKTQWLDQKQPDNLFLESITKCLSWMNLIMIWPIDWLFDRTQIVSAAGLML